MDIVVTLALIVLVAVFLFSLFMIIVTCHRRKQYNRLIESQSQQTMRFTKLQRDNLDDIVQLEPHISRALDRNQWIDELATGLLQHCVAVLKLCHSMTERMAQCPFEQQQCPAELNEMICRATGRVMPRFEALLRSMAARDVDIRVIEARVGALVSVCWALAAPFAVANSSQRDHLEELVRQMDKHLLALQLALDKFEDEQQQQLANNTAATAPSTSSTSTHHPDPEQNHISNSGSTSQMKRNEQKQPNVPNCTQNSSGKQNTGGTVTLRIAADDEANSSLLTEETAPPADPAIT